MVTPAQCYQVAIVQAFVEVFLDRYDVMYG